MLNVEAAAKSSAHIWETEIVPALHEYILIPNKSPAFDRAWKANGHMDRATALIADWCRAQQIPGLTVEVIALTDASGAPRTASRPVTKRSQPQPRERGSRSTSASSAT